MHGCYRQSAKRKGRKNKRGRMRALWNILEFGGTGREKRGKKEKRKRVRVRVWRRKKEGKKRKKRRKCYHNIFTILSQ